MAIDPIPVTFDVRAEPRPELIDARRRRTRPYRTIAQAVGVLTVLGGGLGFLVGEFVRGAPPAAPDAPDALAHAPIVAADVPSFAVWSPPARQTSRQHDSHAFVGDHEGADFAPVGSIRDAASQRSRAFAPAERAPGYAGFKVTAGH